MSDLTSVRVGELLFIQPQRRRNQAEWPDPFEVKVAKVGRRWLTVEGDSWTHGGRVDRHTGRWESSHNDFANGLGRYAFATQPDLEAFVAGVERAEVLRERIGRRVESWRRWDIEHLERLANICDDVDKERS